MRKQKWLKRVSERILPNKPEGILRYKSEGNSVISRNISCDINQKVTSVISRSIYYKISRKASYNISRSISYKKIKRILRYRRNGYIQVQMKKELQITAPFVDLSIDLIRPIRSRQLRHRRHDAGREGRCGYNRRPDRSLPCAVHTWVRAR